jgi:hypothetical protein
MDMLRRFDELSESQEPVANLHVAGAVHLHQNGVVTLNN